MSQERNKGRVVAIQGSVVDVRFDDRAPGLNTRLLAGDNDEIVIEVAGIVGPKTVSGLVLTPNDQLSLAMPVADSGGLVCRCPSADRCSAACSMSLASRSISKSRLRT